MLEKEYVFRVRHPKLGEVTVEAPGRLNALHRAAKGWGQRWTEIARECTINQMGEAPPKKKARRPKKGIATPVCALARNDRNAGGKRK